MREIKFRQAIIHPVTETFVKWHYWGFIDDAFIGIDTGLCSPKVAIERSHQQVGCKDKSKKEIYEDDIYKDAEGIVSRVRMAVDGWALFPVMKKTPVRNLYWQNVCVKTQGVVIGNAHQHPKLLEKQ